MQLSYTPMSRQKKASRQREKLSTWLGPPRGGLHTYTAFLLVLIPKWNDVLVYSFAYLVCVHQGQKICYGIRVAWTFRNFKCSWMVTFTVSTERRIMWCTISPIWRHTDWIFPGMADVLRDGNHLGRGHHWQAQSRHCRIYSLGDYHYRLLWTRTTIVACYSY